MQLYCNLSDMKISLIASAYVTHVLFFFNLGKQTDQNNQAIHLKNK